MINWNFHCFLLFNNCASLRRAWLHLLCVFHQKENSKIPPWFYLCWSFLQETQLSWPLLLCCVLQLPDHLDGLQKTRVASLSWLTLKAGGSLFIFVLFLTAVPLYFIFTCLSLTVRFILSRQWGTCERTLWAEHSISIPHKWCHVPDERSLGTPGTLSMCPSSSRNPKSWNHQVKKKSKQEQYPPPPTHKEKQTQQPIKENQTKQKRNPPHTGRQNYKKLEL